MTVSIDVAGGFKVARPSNADAATGWAVTKLEGAGGAPSLLASVGTIDLVAEGADARAARTNKQRVAIKFTNAAGYDFTSGSTGTGTTKLPGGIAYIWSAFLAAGSLLLKSSGGLQIMLSDGTNTSYWNVAGSDTYSGGFEKWAIYTGISPDENSGTIADLGDITEIGIVTDVGTNVTRFDNFVVDAMEVGDGLTFQGTTTTDKLFAEMLAQDRATAIGLLSDKNGKNFSQGNIELSGTNLVSDGESFTFVDTIGGIYTYLLNITGTVSLTNTIIDANGSVRFSLDTTNRTSFSMAGGSLVQLENLILISGDTLDSVVITDANASSIGNNPNGSTWNKSGLITVETGGKLTKCKVNNATGAVAVLVDDLAKLEDTEFTSSGSGHAVELSSLGSGSMTWDSVTSGYAAGSAGSPVTPTSTGNEDLYVNVGSGTITINVAAGASVPSIRSAGATVNVVAGLVTLTIQTQDGNEVRLRQGSFTLQHTQNVTGGEITYAYTFAANTKITISVGGATYGRITRVFVLPSTDTTLLFDLEPDPSYL